MVQYHPAGAHLGGRIRCSTRHKSFAGCHRKKHKNVTVVGSQEDTLSKDELLKGFSRFDNLDSILNSARAAATHPKKGQTLRETIIDHREGL